MLPFCLQIKAQGLEENLGVFCTCIQIMIPGFLLTCPSEIIRPGHSWPVPATHTWLCPLSPPVCASQSQDMFLLVAPSI